MDRDVFFGDMNQQAASVMEELRREEVLKRELEKFKRQLDGTVAQDNDVVQRPAHYRRFNVEVIDIIRHVLGEEGFRAYCIGNEVKYRLRAGFKNDGAEDLAKAMKYYEFRGGK
jgi:hypothetical protein